METIEAIYENWKYSFDGNLPESKEMKEEFMTFSNELDKAGVKIKDYYKIYDGAVSYALECQKFGFLVGFKMAVKLLRECEA